MSVLDTELERKLSVRSQRQDLIRRGLLKPEGKPSGVRHTNSHLFFFIVLLSVCDLDAPVDLVVVDTRYVATGKSKQPPVPPAKPARSRGTTELLSRSGAGADKQRAASDSDIRSSLNGAATERGVRFGASSQIGEGKALESVWCNFTQAQLSTLFMQNIAVDHLS